MPKRDVSASNVQSKKTKLSNELAGLEAQSERLAFQNELKETIKDLKKNPSKLKTVKIVMAMDEGAVVDKKVEFSHQIANKTLARVPAKHLCDELFPEGRHYESRDAGPLEG